MNSTWLTLVVALLSGGFALAGTWLAARLAARERAANRADRDFELRRTLYATLVLRVDAFARAAADLSGAEHLGPTLAGLRAAASEIEVYSPRIAKDKLAKLTAVAERGAELARRTASSSPPWIEFLDELQAAREALINSLAADLDQRL
ncbi:hypothetical protein PWY87_17365 [Kribbella solani]|uniref:hypothetical protein n=1 Tax=Kribbella solani TaxID=236067 RepID=UPI0029B4D4FE|nr:hypothetical protein [Kribbella solani]MDX3003460.1 hypothetical protein [Kribbella solani]